MSGGSYNYLYSSVLELKMEIRHQDTDPRRAAFALLMELVGKALHDIEWVDSCDYGPGDEHAAIDAVFAFLQADPVTITKARAFDDLKEKLRKLIDSLEKFPNEKIG